MKLAGEWYCSVLDERKTETSLVSDVELLDNGWLRFTLGGKTYYKNGPVFLRQAPTKKAEGDKSHDEL